MPANKSASATVPRRAFRPAFPSVLRRWWEAIFARDRRQTIADLILPGQDFGKHDCSRELHGLIDVLVLARRRILTNMFLRGWFSLWSWILIGLMVAATLSPKLAGAAILAAILMVMGATVIMWWTWWTRPSTYETACRLDCAASLHDRLSTALYFGKLADPDGIILRQRRDALERLSRVGVRQLFPIRIPVTGRRALILALAVSGLFVYRAYYQAPLAALLQTTARSHLMQSILSPFRQAMDDKDVRRTMSRVNQDAEAMDEGERAARSTLSSEDLWQTDDQDDAEQDDRWQSDSQQGNPADQSSSLGNSRESLSQSLMKALQSMLSNGSGWQAQPNQTAQQQLPQGLPQTDTMEQSGATDGDNQRDSQQELGSQKKSAQGTSGGAGEDQNPGTKDLLQNSPLSVKAVPDRVALQPNGLQEQILMRTSTETGTAKIAVSDTLSHATTSVNGAEQENIPGRYRLYVQRYFQRENNNSGN